VGRSSAPLRASSRRLAGANSACAVHVVGTIDEEADPASRWPERGRPGHSLTPRLRAGQRPEASGSRSRSRDRPHGRARLDTGAEVGRKGLVTLEGGGGDSLRRLLHSEEDDEAEISIWQMIAVQARITARANVPRGAQVDDHARDRAPPARVLRPGPDAGEDLYRRRSCSHRARGDFTPAERTLVEHGDKAPVEEIRRRFQARMAEQFRSVVEQATGRGRSRLSSPRATSTRTSRSRSSCSAIRGPTWGASRKAEVAPPRA